MRCEVCGEFLGVGEIGICGDCNALEHDIAEDRCDCCGEVRALCDLGDGFCSALVPRGEEIELMQELVRLRRLDVDDPDLFQKYRSLMIDRIKREGGIAPGVLRAGDDLAAREHVRLRWTRPLRLVYTCSAETARQFPLGSQVLLIDAGRGLTDQRAHLIGRESEDGDTWTLNFALMR